jgi:hypothetical protein
VPAKANRTNHESYSNNTVIAEKATTSIVVENNHYFPADSICRSFSMSPKEAALEGSASYYSLNVNGEKNKRRCLVLTLSQRSRQQYYNKCSLLKVCMEQHRAFRLRLKTPSQHAEGLLAPRTHCAESLGPCTRLNNWVNWQLVGTKTLLNPLGRTDGLRNILADSLKSLNLSGNSH